MAINRIRDVPPEQTYYVSNGFVDDEAEHKFSTIQGAIDYAYSIHGVITDFADAVVISVYPGRYTEQIHTIYGYHINGYVRGVVHKPNTTTLYNTGADAAHYPLRSGDDDTYQIENITIETDSDCVIGKFATNEFYNVVFKGGYFIEATVNKTLFMQFDHCTAYQTMLFNLSGVGTGGARLMTLIKCYFNDYATHWNFDSTHTTTLAIIKDTIFHKFYPDIGGNWKFEISNCHIFGTDRSVISTTNKITIIQSIISNGLHFTSNPTTIIQLCTYNDDCGYPITGEDITSDVIITNVNYVGNIQQNGISGKVQIICPTKPVGCNAANKYYSLQDAVTSVVTKGTVQLFTDLTGVAELTIPGNANVTIDAQKTYSLSFTADVVEINNGSRCAFQNFVNLTGGEILLNGATAEVSFEGCQYITAHLTVLDGIFAIVYNSSFFGDTGYTPITISDLTCPVIIGYSRVQGPTGEPAVDFTVDADDMFKAKYSTFIHGDDASNSPIINTTAADKINFAIYNSALNAAFSSADFTNTVGSPNNTVSAGISF